jgi:CopG family nickel-responsive transcriptional regulator
MSELSRIGVALDSKLLEKFDALIEKQGYQSRSEAFRDLIRAELVQKALEAADSKVVGTISLVYDHHTRLLQDKLTDLQHQYHHSIRSTLHIHLDLDHCLEVIVASGKFAEVQALANTLISTKGVKHGHANWTTSGADL